MPLGVFVPAAAEDLSLSFAVGVDSAAQGSLLYRNNASRYVPLPPGTAGQVLTSGGPAANPLWQSGSADLSPAVILAPTTSIRNVVQPTDAAVIPFTLKGFAAQSAALQQWQDPAGAVLGEMGASGNLGIGSASAAAQQLLVTIAPPTDLGVVIKGAAAQTGNLLETQTSAGANLSSFTASGSIDLANAATGVGINPLVRLSTLACELFPSGFNKNGGQEFVNIVGLSDLTSIFGGGMNGEAVRRIRIRADGFMTWGGGAAAQDTNLFRSAVGELRINNQLAIFNASASTVTLVVRGAASPSVDLQQWMPSSLRRRMAVSSLGDLVFYRDSSTPAERQAFDITTTFATATDASRKARTVFNIWDTAVRECLRMEASGTAAMLGFMGAVASARTAITGSRGGNAALASLLTELATKGLITDSTSA